MHGNSPEFLLLVNAEVDSMGGVIDGGVAVDSKISPRRAAIEKAQAELRQEYDVREERRRELEFLEKGGNPLDFKLGPATSISVQSTSVADQFVNSEAKDSFALTASPRGDSVESSGRPGAALVRETNTADNLLLFNGENEIVERERNSSHHSRSNVPSSEQVSQLDSCHNLKESEESGILRFVVKSQAYARRNRSRSSRDGDRNGSSAFRSRHGTKNAKGIASEATTEKDRIIKSTLNSKPIKPNGNVAGKTLAGDNQLDKGSDARQAHGTASAPTNVGEAEPDVRASKKLRGIEYNKLSEVDDERVTGVRTSMPPDNVVEKEGVSSALNCMPSAASTKGENVNSASHPNCFNTSNVDAIDMPKGRNSKTSFDRKGNVDPEPSSIQIGISLDGNIAGDHHSSPGGTNSSGNPNKETTLCKTSTDQPTINLVKEETDTKIVEVPAHHNDNHTVICLNSNDSGSCVKVEEETGDSRSGTKSEVKAFGNHERTEHKDHIISNAEGTPLGSLVDDSNAKRADLCTQGRPSSTMTSANGDLQEVKVSDEGLLEGRELQSSEENQLKLAKRVHEDSILEEARSIEAKRKRIAELSVRSYPSEYRRKSHWDFVLEEMAWLANDFMQERLWKTTAAAQISHMAASSGRLRINKQNLCCKQRQTAHTLSKAVMEFWHSAEVSSTDPSNGVEGCMSDLVGSEKVDEQKATEDNITDKDMGMSGHLKEQNTAKSHRFAVQGYAVRFLKYSNSLDCPIQAEAPKTPERLSDFGIVEMLLEDRFSEQILFYTVPPGAMEEYRKSVENYWSHYEITGSSMHREEVETSIYGAVEEFGTRESVYEDDEGGAYYIPGAFEVSKSKSAQKKRKHLQKAYARYDVGVDLPYGQFMESKQGINHSSLPGKRPPNNLNVGSIPIKRVRTASRRVVCAGAGGSVQMPSKADASSGDTSSYQDDQSTGHGGSHIRKTLEVESTGEFGKQLPFDCTEVSMKPKKKKKAKHLGYKNSLNSTENGAFLIGKGPAYEQRWQLDSMAQNEQREYSKKRPDNHAFESNGNSGVFGQHATKRPKIMKQDICEGNTPISGSIPSPVASQMSNMSNPNKFMKMIAGQRGRKNKTPKMPAGQSGAGSAWSLFEDQALVVLVHDMGPNWELVSDAINSTLQFKCIYRNNKECKERHKILMDRNISDGADSADDSGSSQPYPSTLPGIPKGSARQLFQRLQGPMEEDTLKSHFEKIILIGQKQHSRRQSDNQVSKQITPVHNSHHVAVSQVCPNNLTGPLLTPLDLCDTTPTSSDVSLGYQGSHSSGLAISSQGPAPPVLPTTSGANPTLQGSASVVLDTSLTSPSSSVNTSSRDTQRYGTPRQSSLPNNENQKMQQYNQMHSGKTSQHPAVASPGSLTTDRGVRILPGGTGMGMMSGMSRGMPMPRPGFQGIGSPGMLNMVSSGSMLPSSGVGMPSPVSMHNGAVSGQGNSMMRPREPLHMMRAPEEQQRQMTVQELHMQVSQVNTQGIPGFNSLSTGYSNQTVPPSVQTFSGQHQSPHVLNTPHHAHLQGNNHTTTPQQQAYIARIAKGQLHQRILQQHNHQQQFASSNVQPPPVQHQPGPLTSSSSSSMNPVSSQPQQNKHHLPPHALARNPQPGSVNNLPKQRQRQQQQQQQQQPGRHPHPHPQQNRQQQQQQTQPQQQGKQLIKGIGRGNNMMMHQNLPIDTSHVNGLMLPQVSAQQKLFTRSPPTSSTPTLLGSKQQVLPSPQLRQVGPSPSPSPSQPQQTVQRMLQQTRQGSSDMATGSPQSCPDSTNVVPVSSASSSGSEQVGLPRQSSGNIQTQWQPHLQQSKQLLLPSSPPLTSHQPPPSPQPPQSGMYAAAPPTNSEPT